MRKYVFFIVILLLSNCFYSNNNKKNNNDSYYSVYGIEFNLERQKRGISLIPKYWICEKFSDGRLSYHRKDVIPLNVPFCGGKTLIFKNNKLIVEKTYFYGIKKYPADPDNPTAMNTQEIDIIYNFEKEKKGEYPWEVWFYYCNIIKHNKSRLELADSVLKSWGLSRLTYNFQVDTPIWLHNKILLKNKDTIK